MDLRNLVWGNFLASVLRCWLMRVHRGMLGNDMSGGKSMDRPVSACVCVIWVGGKYWKTKLFYLEGQKNKTKEGATVSISEVGSGECLTSLINNDLTISQPRQHLLMFLQDLPLFVEMQHHPDAVSSLVDLLDVVLPWDFDHLPKHILHLSSFPLCKTLLSAMRHNSHQFTDRLNGESEPTHRKIYWLFKILRTV